MQVPDLLVKDLKRETIQKVVEQLIEPEELDDEWLCEDKVWLDND